MVKRQTHAYELNECNCEYVGAKSDQQVNICGFAMRCDWMWPSTQ